MSAHPLQLLPEEIVLEADEGREGLLDHNTLLLGAPKMGKSKRLRTKQFDKNPNVTVCQGDEGDDLNTAVEVPNDQLVIIDDFYCAYQQTPTNCRGFLDELFNRDRGVCIITRPWCLDWLLQQNDEQHSLTNEDIQAFDVIHYLQYDRKQNFRIARDATLDIAGQEIEIEEEKDLLPIEYNGYEFESRHLQNYPRSVAPGWAAMLDMEPESEWLSLSNPTQKLRQFGADAALTKAIDRIEGAVQKILSSESIPKAGAVAGAPLGAAGGLLLVWLFLDDSELDSDSVFDALLDIKMTPETKEQIERSWGLPPYTIDNLLELTNPETLDALTQVRRHPPEELAADVDAIRGRVDAFESHLTELNSRVEELREEVSKVEQIIDVEGAAGTLSDFEETIYEDERRLLQTDVARKIPYGGDKPTIIADKIDQNETEIVVVRGPHGTGKSTSVLEACRKLSDRDYSIRLPYFDRNSPESIQENLVAPDRTVVVAHYKRGASGDNVVRDERDLKLLLDWLADNTCSAVILECRDELYPSLTDLPKLQEGRPEIKRRFEAHETVEMRSLAPKGEMMHEIVDWTLEQLDEKPPEQTHLHERVLDLASGNPEIAKIATRYWVTEDDDIDEIETVDDLIWRDIEVLFTDDAIGSDVFEHVSAFREIRTGELERMFPDANLTDIAYHLEEYLTGDVRNSVREAGQELPDWIQQTETKDNEILDIRLEKEDNWKISPDIYAEVTFRRRGLGEGSDSRSKGGFQRYYENLKRVENDESYLGIARNLSLSYMEAKYNENDDLESTIVECAYLLLDLANEQEIEPESYALCVFELVTGRIPLDPDVLQDSISRLIEGSQTVAKELDDKRVDGCSILLGQFGKMWVNNFEFGNNQIQEQFVEVLVDAALRSKSLFEYGQNDFLLNIYSHVVNELVDTHPDPENEAAQTWFRKIRSDAITAVHSADIDVSSGRFLIDMYSMAVGRLADSYQNPNSEPAQAWLKKLLDRTTTIARSGSIEHPHHVSFRSFYGDAISLLAKVYPNPDAEPAQAWLDKLCDHIIETARNEDFVPPSFLTDSYAQAVATLSLRYPDPQSEPAQAWLKKLQTHIITTMSKDYDSNAQFLGDLYAMMICNLIQEQSDPDTEAAQDWFREICDSANTIAHSDGFEVPPGIFLALVYSLTVSNVKEAVPDSEKKQAWLEMLHSKVNNTSQSQAHELSPERFLDIINNNPMLFRKRN